MKQPDQAPPAAASALRLGLAGLRLPYSAEGAGGLAEPALAAVVGSHLQPPFGHRTGQLEQRAVGTQKPAIRPPHKHRQDQQARPRQHHQRAPAHSEHGDKRVVFANEERAAGRGEQDSRAQVHERQQAQAMVQPGGQLDRLEQHQILQRPVRADRRAERPACKQGKGQRQHKKGQHPHRHGVPAVAQRQAPRSATSRWRKRILCGRTRSRPPRTWIALPAPAASVSQPPATSPPPATPPALPHRDTGNTPLEPRASAWPEADGWSRQNPAAETAARQTRSGTRRAGGLESKAEGSPTPKPEIRNRNRRGARNMSPASSD